MGQLLNLQDFTQPEQADPETASADDLARTFDEGFAAGLAAAEDDRGQLDEKSVAALEAAAFTYAEARRDILAQLGPVMAMIAEKLVPELAQAGLSLRVAEHLEALADKQVPDQIQVRAPSAAADAINAILQARDIQHIELHPDDSLADGTVRIAAGPAETEINTDSFVAQFQDALAGIAIDIEDLAQHG